MAEIILSNQTKKPGVPKLRKASLKVDLTPMVDLGFLLISFFVLTNTLVKPKALTLKVPDTNTKDSSKAPVSKTLNIILGAGNAVFTYNGDDIKNISTSSSNLRSVITSKKQELLKRFGSDSDAVILIKPTSDASYENIVSVLNEMLICNIKTYVLMDASTDELKLIQPFH